MSGKLMARIDAVYQYVRRASDQEHLERINNRQRELIRTEYLDADQIEMTDLNSVVAAAVADALPLCKTLGVPLRVWQSSALPRVPVLLDPLRHTIAGLIDLCLDDEETQRLDLRTWAEVDRVIVHVERRVEKKEISTIGWRELRFDARLELVIGAQALRATGGRMSVRSCGHQLHARIELAHGDVGMPGMAEIAIVDSIPKRNYQEPAWS